MKPLAKRDSEDFGLENRIGDMDDPAFMDRKMLGQGRCAGLDLLLDTVDLRFAEIRVRRVADQPRDLGFAVTINLQEHQIGAFAHGLFHVLFAGHIIEAEHDDGVFAKARKAFGPVEHRIKPELIGQTARFAQIIARADLDSAVDGLIEGVIAEDSRRLAPDGVGIGVDQARDDALALVKPETVPVGKVLLPAEGVIGVAFAIEPSEGFGDGGALGQNGQRA